MQFGRSGGLEDHRRKRGSESETGRIDGSRKAAARHGGDIIQGYLETADVAHTDDAHKSGRELVLGHDEGAKGEVGADGGHGPDEIKDG